MEVDLGLDEIGIGHADARKCMYTCLELELIQSDEVLAIADRFPR